VWDSPAGLQLVEIVYDSGGLWVNRGSSMLPLSQAGGVFAVVALGSTEIETEEGESK